MLGFHKKIPASVIQNEQKAQELKAQAVKGPNTVAEKADKLNRLLLADGITLKIFYATGADHRGNHD